MTEHEKTCLAIAKETYEIDKRCDRTAVILPIHVTEVLIRLAEQDGEQE